MEMRVYLPNDMDGITGGFIRELLALFCHKIGYFHDFITARPQAFDRLVALDWGGAPKGNPATSRSARR